MKIDWLGWAYRLPRTTNNEIMEDRWRTIPRISKRARPVLLFSSSLMIPIGPMEGMPRRDSSPLSFLLGGLVGDASKGPESGVLMIMICYLGSWKREGVTGVLAMSIWYGVDLYSCGERTYLRRPVMPCCWGPSDFPSKSGSSIE